jgi:hypothetical protein
MGLFAAAVAWMDSEGIRRPERMAMMAAPLAR